jgi:hypothetical protein
MRPVLTPEQQVALVEYTAERRQLHYRLELLREAERDLRNKTVDYQIAQERTEQALSRLLAECAQ